MKPYRWIRITAEALITVMCLHLLSIRIFQSWLFPLPFVLRMMTAVFILAASVVTHRLIERYIPFVLGKLQKKTVNFLGGC